MPQTVPAGQILVESWAVPDNEIAESELSQIFNCPSLVEFVTINYWFLETQISLILVDSDVFWTL